jgi:hypothetical protein
VGLRAGQAEQVPAKKYPQNTIPRATLWRAKASDKKIGSMKKLLLLAAVAIFAVACNEGDVTLGEDLKVRSVEVPVQARDWVGVDAPDGFYFMATVRTSVITRYACDHGTVNAYMILDGGAQSSLPQTRHFIKYAENPADDYMWTRTIDYEFSPGEITFFCTDSDFPLDPERPGAMYFRVVTSGGPSQNW